MILSLCGAWIIVAFVGLLSPAAIAQTNSMSVCEILNSVADNQKTVVHGEVIGEPEHGFYLSEGINIDPCPGWRQHILTAPSIVGLEFVSSTGVFLTSDQEQADAAFLSHLRALSRSAPLDRHYTVTLEGVLRRKRGAIIMRRSDGAFVGNGLGPGGNLLAILVITSVRQEKDYGDR